MLGVIFGFTILVTIMNFGLINIFQKLPILQEILKYAGSLFLLYLAYKISFSKNNPNNKKPTRYSNINLIPFTEQEQTIRIINQINQKNILRIRRERLLNNKR